MTVVFTIKHNIREQGLETKKRTGAQPMPIDLIRGGLARDKAYALMNGKSRRLYLGDLVIIAKVFGCKVEDLYSVTYPSDGVANAE